MEADPISSYPTPTTSYAQARRNDNNLWKVLFAFQEKTQLTSAGKVRSFPVLGSLSVSWSSSRGSAGILTTRSSCGKLQNKSTGCVLQGQSTKSTTKEIAAFPKHTFSGWNVFTQSNLSTTRKPNLQGTPESHLHVARKKPGKWCSIFMPGPYWEATDSFQDKKKHLGILFNMETWYLNLVPEDLGWTFRFWVPAVSW